MDLQERKFVVRLWREDLGEFYLYFLKTVVLDLDRFEYEFDYFKNRQNSIRKFRTATLIGIALVQERIFDKRWMLGKLLGPEFTGYFSDRELMNLFFDAIISTPEAREHVRRANEYLNSDFDWNNNHVQSIEGQKAIKVAMMRSAVRTHNVNKCFIPYYGRGIRVVW